VRNISRTISTKSRRAAAVATSVSIVLATVMLVSVSGSQAATAHSASKCHIVVTGAHWRIKTHFGLRSGNRYTVVANGLLCSFARPWVVEFTHRKSKALGASLHGPQGLKCHSLSTAATGDRLVYAGACGHGTGYKPPGFGWGPRIRP
jgi:hypothetical protein